MKKFVSLALGFLLLITLIPFRAEAADNNIAPIWTAYSSADFNEWAPKTAINDQNYGSSWQAQHIQRDPSVGTVGEYCGVRHSRNHYSVSEIRVCVGTHGNEVTYSINALYEGEWIKLGEFKESDTTEIDGKAWYILTLDEPIVTNDIRLIGEDYVGWDLPYVCELEVYGSKVETPDVVVPEGGEVTQNAALEGLAYASSAADGCYPALINDDNLESKVWRAAGSELPAYAGVRFSKTRTIHRITVFTGVDEGSPYSEAFNVEALIDGVWTVIVSGVCNASNDYTFDCTLSQKVISDNVRVVFTEANTIPQLYELQIHSEERNVFVPANLTNTRMSQIAAGNVAVLGTPYALTTFELYSSVSSINDSVLSGKGAMWVAEGGSVPTYCGVTLPFAYDVNKVVIYFEDEGDSPHIMKFDVQVLSGEEYVTVATGYSYNKTTGYTAILEFDTVTTSDIRILFTKNGNVFPNLNELQVYASEDFIYNPYRGYETELTVGGPVQPAAYEEEASKIEAPLTYDTTTRNTPDPTDIAALLSNASSHANVLSTAIGTVALSAAAAAVLLILNKKNL